MVQPSDLDQPKSGNFKDLSRSVRKPLSVRKTAGGQIIMTLRMNNKQDDKPTRAQMEAQDTLNRKRRHLISMLPLTHPLRNRVASRGVLIPSENRALSPSLSAQPSDYEIPDEDSLLQSKQRKCRLSGEERESAQFNMSCRRLRRMWDRSDLNISQELERQTVRLKMEETSRYLRLERILSYPVGCSPAHRSRSNSMPVMASNPLQYASHGLTTSCMRRRSYSCQPDASRSMVTDDDNNNADLADQPVEKIEDDDNSDADSTWTHVTGEETNYRPLTEREWYLQNEEFLASSYWI